MDNREMINDVLVHLFNEIMKLEEEAIITEEFRDITNNDMHIIEAVGMDGGNMSGIAAKLNITVGSLTTSMNSLVKKEYVERERSERDRRVVYIHLTKKGRRAYRHHQEFHAQMTDAILQELTETEVPVLSKALESLSTFFHQYGKNTKKR
ncbi:MAG: MarR family transcriptional regulator [Lachnospiraceae bacterium]|nr:MarR family transcriptional regulator [Lachnospiraceae bacterium]